MRRQENTAKHVDHVKCLLLFCIFNYFKIPSFINHSIDLLLSEGISYVQEQQRHKTMKALRKPMGQAGQVELFLPKVLTRFMLWHVHQAFMSASCSLSSDA